MVAPKSIVTNWHAVVIVLCLVVVPVAGKYLGLSNDMIAYLTGAVVSLAVASGFIHAADATALQQTADTLAAQTNNAINIVKDDVHALKVSAASVPVKTATVIQEHPTKPIEEIKTEVAETVSHKKPIP